MLTERRRTLDFWGDLARTVDRAGGDPERLWVDDSKAILLWWERSKQAGRDVYGGDSRRLEHASSFA